MHTASVFEEFEIVLWFGAPVSQKGSYVEMVFGDLVDTANQSAFGRGALHQIDGIGERRFERKSAMHVSAVIVEAFEDDGDLRTYGVVG